MYIGSFTLDSRPHVSTYWTCSLMQIRRKPKARQVQKQTHPWILCPPWHTDPGKLIVRCQPTFTVPGWCSAGNPPSTNSRVQQIGQYRPNTLRYSKVRTAMAKKSLGDHVEANPYWLWKMVSQLRSVSRKCPHPSHRDGNCSAVRQSHWQYGGQYIRRWIFTSFTSES